MKKTLAFLFILFLTRATAWAQSCKIPVMTTAFADSLKKRISKVIPPDYFIKLSYQSKISTDGKLLKPLITREFANGTIEDNEIVQKLRFLIMDAPAWYPATDKTSNTTIEGTALFDIEIKEGKISIVDTTK